MHYYGGVVELVNTVVDGNFAGQFGGGMLLGGSSSSSCKTEIVEGTTLSGNIAVHGGAQVRCASRPGGKGQRMMH